MNPRKKALQIELATEIMLAEISGTRASGQSGFIKYIDIFKLALSQAEHIADFIEEDVTGNMDVWETEQRGNLNEKE